MAISASSYFSNSLVGQMQIGSDVDIYETSSLPKFSIGTGFQRQDGNKYRYAQFGALTARGQVVAVDHFESSVPSATPLIFGAALVSPTLVKIAGINTNPNATGSRYLQILLTATAEQFAGGYLTTVSGSGSGYSYRIKGNVATGTPSTGYTYVDLYEPLAGPIDSTTVFSVVGCKYANVKPAIGTVAVAASACALAGVAVANQTSGNFGWVCTKGITHVLQAAETATLSNLAMISTNTAGAVTRWTLTTSPAFATLTVGVYLIPASSTGYSTIDVTIE